MRGIGNGQTIEVLIIPEIEKLIRKTISVGTTSIADSPKGQLYNILAWLILNQMRSERVQFHVLCEQNIANLWRKRTFNIMKRDLDKLTEDISSDASQRKLNVYRERIDYTVENTVPVDHDFMEKVKRNLSEYRDILKDKDIEVLEKIKAYYMEARSKAVDNNEGGVFKEKAFHGEQEQESKICGAQCKFKRWWRRTNDRPNKEEKVWAKT